MTVPEARAPRNVLIVATANKLARIAWRYYRAVKTIAETGLVAV
jgi:hypothetical protein